MPAGHGFMGRCGCRESEALAATFTHFGEHVHAMEKDHRETDIASLLNEGVGAQPPEGMDKFEALLRRDVSVPSAAVVKWIEGQKAANVERRRRNRKDRES